MNRCAHCGRENPRGALRCRGCRASLPRHPDRQRSKAEPPAPAGSHFDLHAARTLVVPEEAPEAPTPSASRLARPGTAAPSTTPTAGVLPGAAPRTEPAAADPPDQRSPTVTPDRRRPARVGSPAEPRTAAPPVRAEPRQQPSSSLVPPVSPAPPALPQEELPALQGSTVPWGTPTDQPRPIRPMQRAASEGPSHAWLSTPQPPGPGLDAGRGSAASLSQSCCGGRLMLEDHAGQVIQEVELPLGLTRLGRTAGDILFRDDPFVAATHGWLNLGPQGARIRDAGTINGIYLHQLEPQLLGDGDALVVGSQLLLLRTTWRDDPCQEGTQRFGSAGWLNPYRFLNLRLGGDLVLVHYLDGPLVIGRDLQPEYRQDRFLARQHLRIERTVNGVLVSDCSGGRGFFLRLRAETWLADGQRFLVGGKLLRLQLRYDA